MNHVSETLCNAALDQYVPLPLIFAGQEHCLKLNIDEKTQIFISVLYKFSIALPIYVYTKTNRKHTHTHTHACL